MEGGSLSGPSRPLHPRVHTGGSKLSDYHPHPHHHPLLLSRRRFVFLIVRTAKICAIAFIANTRVVTVNSIVPVNFAVLPFSLWSLHDYRARYYDPHPYAPHHHEQGPSKLRIILTYSLLGPYLEVGGILNPTMIIPTLNLPYINFKRDLKILLKSHEAPLGFMRGGSSSREFFPNILEASRPDSAAYLPPGP